jgi:hypothetical protein
MTPINAIKIQEALAMPTTLPVILHSRTKDNGESRYRSIRRITDEYGEYITGSKRRVNAGGCRAIRSNAEPFDQGRIRDQT